MHIVLHFHKTELCGVEPYYFLTEEEARTYIKWAFANNPALDYKDSMKIQKLERDDYDKGPGRHSDMTTHPEPRQRTP